MSWGLSRAGRSLTSLPPPRDSLGLVFLVDETWLKIEKELREDLAGSEPAGLTLSELSSRIDKSKQHISNVLSSKSDEGRVVIEGDQGTEKTYHYQISPDYKVAQSFADERLDLFELRDLNKFIESRISEIEEGVDLE